MAEVCKDIDQGLADLKAAINRVNNRLDGLERKQKACCDDQNKNQPTDLSAILKRLDKIEKDILELGGVIQTVIDDLKDLLDAATEHNETANSSQNIFSAIIDFFVDE